MENTENISGTGINEVVIKDPILPASDADEKKSDIPGATDDTAKVEVTPESPEQQEAKKQSRRAAKREREIAAKAALETENRMLREQIAKAAPQKAAPESGEPKRDDFSDYEAYLDARSDWRADQKAQAVIKADREASQGREKQAKESSAVDATAKAWSDRETAFKATAKDYEDVVGAFIEDGGLDSFSDGARRLIVDSEVGPQLLMHLGGDAGSADAERIAKLSPTRQIVELGKLEDSLSAEPQVAPKKVSSAPAPIRPVGQGRGNTNGYSDNMSDAEYKEWRSKSGARWAKH